MSSDLYWTNIYQTLHVNDNMSRKLSIHEMQKQPYFHKWVKQYTLKDNFMYFMHISVLLLNDANKSTVGVVSNTIKMLQTNVV